ncbi:hypothetical protein pb186bvf_016312 [Paramecium bursaria]
MVNLNIIEIITKNDVQLELFQKYNINNQFIHTSYFQSFPFRAGRFGLKATQKIGFVNIFFFGSLVLIYGESFLAEEKYKKFNGYHFLQNYKPTRTVYEERR